MDNIKKQLRNFLNEPINIALENIPFTGELTNFLYSEPNINKIYLINYDSSIFNDVKQVISNKEVHRVESLNTSHLSNEAIILCLDSSNYFNPSYSLLVNHKSVRAICFLGFPESVFLTTPKSPKCSVIHKSISDLITSSKTISALHSNADIRKARICHNRTIEKNALTNFLAAVNGRLLIIHGFPGYGKSNLLDELKRIAPNREYIPFSFESKSDTYKDIISEIAPSFSQYIAIDELYQTKISDRSRRELVKDFFNSFNARENSTLVFDSVHNILNRDSNIGVFVSNEMKLFFELLITHIHFQNSNKIIFLSRIPLQINDEIRKFTNEIKIRELEPFYIKRIMADEYNRINRPELSAKIGTYTDDEKLTSLISGHPTLALRFVDASLKHGLEEMLHNEDFRKQIGYELKMKWLMDNYPLEKNEKSALEILGLFTSEIPGNFINAHFNNAHIVLEALVNRYLIDTLSYADGVVRYFVPNLIKDYIKGISDPEVITKNHVILADYYWKRAEDITVSSQEKILSYRKGFYHFREGKSHDKLKLFVIRFREKFMIEATEATRNKMWHDAYFYFNELHQSNQIDTRNPIEYNQFLKVLSKIKPKPKNTEELITEIHNMFPNDSFIAITYADYLYDKNQPDLLQEAIKECYRIKDVLEKSPQTNRGFSTIDKAIIDNTLAKCLFKDGKVSSAINLVENWKKYFENYSKPLTDKEKYHYQAILMTHYRGLDDYETYVAFKKQALERIKAKYHSLPNHVYFSNRYTYCFKGNQSIAILEQFEKVEAFRHDLDKVSIAKVRFTKNVIEESPFINMIKSHFNNTSPKSLDIDGLDDIENLIAIGKQLLDKIKSISNTNNFPAEYSKIGLMEVEADLYILKTILQNTLETNDK